MPLSKAKPIAMIKNRIKMAGIDASAHLTMNLTIEWNGISISIICTREKGCSFVGVVVKTSTLLVIFGFFAVGAKNEIKIENMAMIGMYIK